MDKKQEFLKRILATFRLEAEENINNITSQLIELENGCTPERQEEILEQIYRAAHSMKGASRAVNLSEIERICHAFEDVMSAIRNGKVTLSAEVIELFNEVTDLLSEVLFENDGVITPSLNEKIEYMVYVLSCAEMGEAIVLKKKKKVLKKKSAKAPEQADVPNAKLDERKTQPSQVAVEEQQVKPVVKAPGTKLSANDTIRISTKRMDKLLNQAEEMLSLKLVAAQRTTDLKGALAKLHLLSSEAASLIECRHDLAKSLKSVDGTLNEAALEKMLQFFDWSHSFIDETEKSIKDLYHNAQQEDYTTASHVESLLNDVKGIITVPFSFLLDGYPKMVRDIAKDLDKKVNFKVDGDAIEIDRRILENLRTPLMHILRNSIDYGIEEPELRLRNGKPEKGNITISIEQPESSKVEIVIADDGAGLDVEKLKRLYIEKENIAAQDRDKLKPEVYLNYIFKSGVSTSDIVTDLSGRGLGLAIVQEAIEQVEGEIKVESVPGQSTTFRILLPVSILTFRGVLVSVGKRSFIAPTTKMRSVMRVTKDQITTIENKATILFEGKQIPVADLSQILELNNKVEPAEYMQLIILSIAHKRFALVVDAILGEQEVLVKAFNKQLRRVRNIAGATVLGSGEVVPILNASDLQQSIMRHAASYYRPNNDHDEEKESKPRILIVEDSITSRTLLKNVMETKGYEVTTAIDGMDGYSKLLEQGPFAAVMSDVEMPRMSGFDLTAKIRATKEVEKIPVVLITSLSKREDKERGVDVGANAYIVKSNFEQSNLFDILESLI